MANKVITVTDPSVVTNDTLLGYNNYSDIDGQLGTTMTPTEATNGKTVTLSDGVVHEVTTKPVGTTNGEFSAVVSNAVEVNLSSGYILDTYSNGIAAYSLRKLRSAYTGSAIKIRRSSDSATLDIGFDGNGDLDTAAAATFLGASDGWLDTFYDQSGNAYDLLSQIVGKQAKAFAGGSPILKGGKPTIDYSVDPNSESLYNSAITDFESGNAFSIFGLSSGETVDSINTLTLFSNDTVTRFQVRRDCSVSNIAVTHSGNTVQHALCSTQRINGVFVQQTVITNGTFINVWDNGSAGTNITTMDGTYTNDKLVIGEDPFKGYISEVIYFNVDKTSERTAIEGDVNSYYTI